MYKHVLVYEQQSTRMLVAFLCVFCAFFGNRAIVPQLLTGAMQQIVSAVAYCHRQFVLHGDLKPENVLIGGVRPDGSPFCIVCDFGHTTVCIGSVLVAAPGDPRYIAPEVIAKENLSSKSDVYMLGVTAFELLTGWLPFFNLRPGDASDVLSFSLACFQPPLKPRRSHLKKEK